MRKIFLIPAIVLLICCVTVGAFNAVGGQNNRPLTFTETLSTLADIEYSIDDMALLVNSIQEVWATDTSESGGGESTRPDSKFGQKGYQADTGMSWLDTILEVVSNFCFTFFALIQLVVLVCKDTTTTIATLFNLMVKFFFGVPA